MTIDHVIFNPSHLARFLIDFFLKTNKSSLFWYSWLEPVYKVSENTLIKRIKEQITLFSYKGQRSAMCRYWSHDPFTTRFYDQLSDVNKWCLYFVNDDDIINAKENTINVAFWYYAYFENCIAFKKSYYIFMTLIIQKRYTCRLMWVMGPERGLLIEDLKREIESIKKRNIRK